MRRIARIAAALVCVPTVFVVLPPASAEDAPAFDRPGIAFSTSTLPRGAFAWEQGLPDATGDDSDGIRTTTWAADTLLRLGVAESLELQLGADRYGGVRVRGGGRGPCHQSFRNTGAVPGRQDVDLLQFQCVWSRIAGRSTWRRELGIADRFTVGRRNAPLERRIGQISRHRPVWPIGAITKHLERG